jgi:hypothetical protein
MRCGGRVGKPINADPLAAFVERPYHDRYMILSEATVEV